MVDAIDNALSLKDEAAYLNPPTSQPNIPLDPVIASVQARFLDIHAELPNAEKSFEKLRRFIKCTYLMLSDSSEPSVRLY
jgi:hypothetical protein